VFMLICIIATILIMTVIYVTIYVSEADASSGICLGDLIDHIISRNNVARI
jgi:hypothetical protein